MNTITPKKIAEWRETAKNAPSPTMIPEYHVDEFTPLLDAYEQATADRDKAFRALHRLLRQQDGDIMDFTEAQTFWPAVRELLKGVQ